MLPYEKKVYSQNGEDGIIEYLLNFIDCNKTFLEIGWGRGDTNCCKNLAVNHGFSGTGIDARKQKFKVQNVNVIVKYITLDDIDFILSLQGLEPDVFSLDIDSFDWHLLNGLMIKPFRPKIIVHEYNSLLGETLSITRSNNPGTKYDKSMLYGASLTAYSKLLKSKYNFVTVDSKGVNAFWIRNDYKIPDNIENNKFIRLKDIDTETVLQKDNSWIEV